MTAKKSAAKPATPKEQPELAKPHELMLTSAAQNASVMDKFSVYGAPDLSALLDGLGKKIIKVQDGDMQPVEAMLYGQAQALQAIFTNMARRSGMNAGEYMKASETYMRMALKAQAQCRATLETLAIVKNPQPYIRQANIAQGPQQVNNSYATTSAHDGITTVKTLENSPSPALSTQYAQGKEPFQKQYAQAHTGAGNFTKEPNELLEGKP